MASLTSAIYGHRPFSVLTYILQRKESSERLAQTCGRTLHGASATYNVPAASPQATRIWSYLSSLVVTLRHDRRRQ